MPLRIAIDASRSTLPRPTGTENYARRLIQHFAAANLASPEPHELTLYFRDAPDPDLFPVNAKTRQVVVPWARAWTHLRFARELWAARPDVCFVPAHTLPLLFPGPALVTVHDLGYKRFPAAHPLWQRWYLDMSTAHSQSRATLILADSQATAADLRYFYGTSPSKIRVLYPGVNADALAFDAADCARVRLRYQLPERFFPLHRQFAAAQKYPRLGASLWALASAAWRSRDKSAIGWRQGLAFRRKLAGWRRKPAHVRLYRRRGQRRALEPGAGAGLAKFLRRIWLPCH